jgi:hypothetical protein
MLLQHHSTFAESPPPQQRTVRVTISLVETWRRDVIQNARGTEDERELDLAAWLRGSACAWEHVTKAHPIDLPVQQMMPPSHRWVEPRCGAFPSAPTASAYVTLLEPETCNRGAACEGDAAARLLNTSNVQRFRQREHKRYRHVLKPLGCRLHLLGEPEVTSCLRGRSLLNMGSDVIVNLMRGFGRLNRTLQSWTRQRPAVGAQARLPFRLRPASVADWAYQFERTGGFNGRGPDVMAGRPQFGPATVTTQFLQHPPHYGLANILDPDGVALNASGRVGFRRTEQFERFMCKHDLVVLESGLADFALSISAGPSVTFSTNRVRPACAGSRDPATCEAALAPALHGEDWRRHPMRAYRQRLAKVLDMWRRCRAAKPHFRGIFHLSPAPRARQSPSDCKVAQWGFSTQAHHLRVVNEAARELVTGAGFEVFEAPFALALHAPPQWFDDAKYGVRYKIHESEALSDLTTQALLAHICPGK